jgi:hypothetical protein
LLLPLVEPLTRRFWTLGVLEATPLSNCPLKLKQRRTYVD